MAKFIYKIDNTFIGSDGTVSLIIGPKKNPIFSQNKIIPGETIIETNDEKVIFALKNDKKYLEVFD